MIASPEALGRILSMLHGPPAAPPPRVRFVFGWAACDPTDLWPEAEDTYARLRWAHRRQTHTFTRVVA